MPDHLRGRRVNIAELAGAANQWREDAIAAFLGGHTHPTKPPDAQPPRTSDWGHCPTCDTYAYALPHHPQECFLCGRPYPERRNPIPFVAGKGARLEDLLLLPGDAAQLAALANTPRRGQ